MKKKNKTKLGVSNNLYDTPGFINTTILDLKKYIIR